MKNSDKFTKTADEQQKALQARMALEDAMLGLIEKWDIHNWDELLSPNYKDKTYVTDSPDKIYQITITKCLRWDSGLNATDMSYYTIAVFKQSESAYSFDCEIKTPNYERCLALWERIKDAERNRGAHLKEEFEVWLKEKSK
jgi:hypothetical protein